MKIISDIRIYKSDVENIDGNMRPHGFASKAFNITLTRIVMKLRENGLSLGNFDHLYINLTTCPVEGDMAPAKRSIDSYHPWYRYYDIAVGENMPSDAEIIFLVEQLLARFFSSEDFPPERIHACIEEAVTLGEQMTIHLKEKRSATRRAVIYLRKLNNGYYLPLLQVYDSENRLLFQADLPEMFTLDALGEIQVTSKKVTIKPRKNAFTENMQPITFTY